MTDIKEDIDTIMDKAKLSAGNFLQGTVSMSVLVMRARSDLKRLLTEYIEKRDARKEK